uniref:Rhamnan synthesis protein F n=1 Tax=viral metagenome TaxID=1070528 RepID=A0A6C0AFL1_9ZZZZ
MEEFKTQKFLVIYVYYEIKNYQKNQTNLSFFIRHGLNEKNWIDLNIDYLFVLHCKCEVLFPKNSNIYFLEEENCTDWEGYLNGLNFMGNKKYDYIFFMNCSVIGPMIENNSNTHWLFPYYQKIINEKSVVCGNIIHNLPETDLGGPGLCISCYNFLLKSTDEILGILKNQKICNVNEKSLVDFEKKYNTVFGKKIDKTDAILTGEFGLSRILLKNGYTLSCLLYEPVDYQKGIFKTTNTLYSDRYKCHFEENLPVTEMIFYKNIWRWENTRASLPVEYDKCKEFIFQKSNFNEDIFNDIDFDILDCNSSGITTPMPEYNWSSKKKFYEIHGYAEEIIFFPKKLENNIAVVIYHHYDPDNIIKDYILQGIKCLIVSGYDIIFCTSSEKINNVDLPFNIIFMDNYGAGTDFICYYDIIKNNINLFKKKYKYLLFTNDSVAFPINGNEKFIEVVKTQRNISDFWGHWNSPEIQLHLIGTLIEFKINLIDDVLKFLEIKIGDYKINKKSKDYYIKEVEVKFLQFLLDKNYKYSCVIDYQNHNFKGHITPFYPHNIYKWINDKNCFAIKWKYMGNYLDLDSLKNPNLNYLLRYLHFGSKGPLGNYEISSKIDASVFLQKFKKI